MTAEVHSTVKPLVMAVLQELMTNYLGPLYQYVSDHQELVKTTPGFLLNHDKLVVLTLHHFPDHSLVRDFGS